MKRTAALFLFVSLNAWGESRFAWPNPDMIEAVDVPDTLNANGVPIRLKMIRVKRGWEEMVRVYVKAFEEARLYIPPQEHQPQFGNERMLTALDPKRQVSYSVIFQPRSDGTTTLILGEANLSLRQAPKPPALPVFPNSEKPVVTQQEGATVLTYETGGEAAQVQDFYREVLGKAGFLPEALSGTEGTVFSRPGEEIRVVLSANPKAKQHSVVVIQRLRGTEEGSPQQVRGSPPHE